MQSQFQKTMTGSILCCIVLLAGVFGKPSVPKDLEPFYLEVLQNTLSSRTLNTTLALEVLARFNSSRLLQSPINGMNMLHHTFDLYMLSRESQQRKQLIEIASLMIGKGVDVTAVHPGHPDLLSKSIIIRNMQLAKKLAEHGAPAETNSALLRLMYAVPCDIVPLAKLLLHADTITRYDSCIRSSE
jgi:hypothetical protein